MSPEANLLRLAYIDINALLVEGFDTNAESLVALYRATDLGVLLWQDGEKLYGVAKTLTEIRDLLGADAI